jgi:ABC-type lipoprotein export system ATPase subunit
MLEAAVEPIPVRANGIVRVYRNPTGPVRALDGVDASIHRGQMTAIAGPSGSGKSTLLRILAMLDRPDSGEVLIEGADVSALRVGQRRVLRRERVGYVSQRPTDNIVPHLSAMENLRFSAGLRQRGSDPHELLQLLGLSHRADHTSEQLSGGEQQRLAIACAVIGEPTLVLADEPTAELDANTSARVLDFLRELASRGSTFAVATHDPTVIGGADAVVRLHSPRDRRRTAHRTPAYGRSTHPAGARTVRNADPPWRPSTASNRRTAPTAEAAASDVEALVRAVGLRKSFTKGPETVVAVRDATFTLRRGEIVALVGPSGSGKTTLLNLLAGWERPDEGNIEWSDGSGIRFDARPWSEMGILPQQLGLMEELSVRENVTLPILLGRRGVVHRDAHALIAALDLDGIEGRLPHEISLGEGQRCALARALALSPDLVLADEPTAHQDEAWAIAEMEVFRAAADDGASCLIATHAQGVIDAADRLLVMEDGAVQLADGTRIESD